MRRLTLLLIVALGLAPGTWLRAPPPPESTGNRQILSVVPLRVPPVNLGEFRLAGAWSLASPNRHFGGYSALVGLPGGTLFAVSDRGRMLWFTPPGRTGHVVRFDYFAQSREGEKALADVEGLTRDPVGGGMWATFEQRNMIVRYDTRFRHSGQVRPSAMRDWPANTGPGRSRGSRTAASSCCPKAARGGSPATFPPCCWRRTRWRAARRCVSDSGPRAVSAPWTWRRCPTGEC